MFGTRVTEKLSNQF